jgi:peptide/nickel transport system permease protein
VSDQTTLSAKSPSRRRVWSRSRSLLLGVAILVTLFGLAAAASVLARYDPLQQNVDQILLPPSAQHWLGTDNLGRDVWSRLLYAARTDLRVGFLAVLPPFLLGCSLGALAGYYGGWVDVAVTSAGNLVMAFPYYVLIVSLVFVFGAGVRSIYLALAIVAWVSYARIIRGEVLRTKRLEYILAARATGSSDSRILVRHIMPNVITQGIVYVMGDIVVIIVGIVTLSYLGLGVPPPAPDWGSMISDGQAFIATRWQLATFPGLAVVVTGIGLALAGDGLAEVLRPE